MGGNHSHQFDQKLFQTQWEKKQGGLFDGRPAWRNKLQPSREIEEYTIFADSENEIEILRELFDLRKDSTELVAASHLKETVKGGLCSSAAQGRLFLERIPLRLQAIEQIPFPDVLHLYFNTLTGYKRLHSVVGAFRPQNEQIGFNNAGEAKVWLNEDFSASTPLSRQVSQAAMVRNLLQIIEEHTDNHTTPRDNPSVLNYIYRNKNEVTFDQALSSLKEYANQYNGGVIPKNLECIQKVGIDKIIRITTSKEGSHVPNITPIQGSTLNSNVVVSQPPVNTYQPQSNINGPLNGSTYYQPRQPLFVPNTIPYNTPQIQGNLPLYRDVQNVQNFQPVQNLQPAQNVQPFKTFQPIQNIQPIQHVPVMQPVQQFGTSGVRTLIQQQNPAEQRFLQSQVQTVRPSQSVLVRSPQEQRVNEPIVRSSIRQFQVVSQLPNQSVVVNNSVDQQSQFNTQAGQVFYQNTPFIQPVPVHNEVVVQNPTATPQLLQKQSQIETLRRLQSDSQPQPLPEPQQASQVPLQTVTRAQTFANQFSEKGRNFIDSNPMRFGIESEKTQELESYDASPEKRLGGLSFEPSSSRFKEVSLEDGKSSEALLAALRGYSSTSSRKVIQPYNAYQYTQNTYSTRTENNYEFNKEPYSYKPVAEQTTDLYSTFNKYATGPGLEESNDLKYSMTKNLYEPTTTTNYKFEPRQVLQGTENLIESQYEYSQDMGTYQQQGEYHVDFDPQILADIQKLKG